MRSSLILAICILFLASWLVLATPVAAKSVYVTDHFRITLRQSPSQTAQIKSMLSTGDRLEILETRENWLRVRTDEGQTGWILRRFSMERLPRALVVDRLRERVETLEKENTRAEQRIRELTQARNRLSEDLESTNQTLQQVQGEYEELRNEVPDLPRIKEQLEQRGKELKDSQPRRSTTPGSPLG